MSRRNGFVHADVATGYFNDPKVKKLRRLVDRGSFGDAVATHVALLLGSWAEGRRLTVDETLPDGIESTSAMIVALRQAGLIDRQGRLPKRSWDSWYGEAFARRASARASGIEGARRRWAPIGDPNAPPYAPPLGTPMPDTTLQTDRQTLSTRVVNGRAREAAKPPRARPKGGPTTLGDALAGTPLGESIAAKSRERT